jgi:lipoprotein-releasing system ATP-binding protein
MIQVKQVYKQYGELMVLKGIDLHINKSEILCITGSSGAGKTTLLQLMGSLDRPTRGEILIDGVAINALSSKNAANFRNQKIGFVFQFHHLLPEFDALENICIPALIKGDRPSEARKKAEELANYLNISNRLHHKPSELSGGEQQRVAIARALINNPSVIFADEPSGNLDATHAEELHQLFFDLREKFGQTYVIVTHNLELAKRSDRQIIMKDGKLI